jgi:regulator of protease activity HflC (stomatin/prohibitin superfamily)
MDIIELGYNSMDIIGLVIIILLLLILAYKLAISIRLVSTRSAHIVERLGKYNKTLEAGFHIPIPFFDRVVDILDLKEETIFVPPQDCFTMDNVRVEVDGVIYISVVDPVNACYGVIDYKLAAIQLAQTTTRSVIGAIDLDRTFEERDLISTKVLEVLSEVQGSWGINVHRYEVKNISPPSTVKKAMERQLRAERNRRALIAKSEGTRQSKINKSEGEKIEMINKSEGEMQRKINEAEGRAIEIIEIATATASSTNRLAEVIIAKGGKDAVKLRLSQEYISKLNNLANSDTNILLPVNIAKLDDLLNSLGLD